MSCTLYLSTDYVFHSIFLYSYILTPYLVMLVAQHLGHPKCFKSTHWQWSVYYLATNFRNELKKNPNGWQTNSDLQLYQNYKVNWSKNTWWNSEIDSCKHHFTMIHFNSLLASYQISDPFVQRLVNANPGLNFYVGFFNPLFKSLFGIIFSILCRASDNQILFSFKFSIEALRSEIKFCT